MPRSGEWGSGRLHPARGDPQRRHQRGRNRAAGARRGAAGLGWACWACCPAQAPRPPPLPPAGGRQPRGAGADADPGPPRSPRAFRAGRTLPQRPPRLWPPRGAGRAPGWAGWTAPGRGSRAGGGRTGPLPLEESGDKTRDCIALGPLAPGLPQARTHHFPPESKHGFLSRQVSLANLQIPNHCLTQHTNLAGGVA